MRRSGWLLMLCIATTAHADWPAGGKYVFTPDDCTNGTRLVRWFDLPSGDLYIVGVGTGTNSNGYSVQRISAQGDIAPGWPVAGVDFNQVSKSVRSMWQGFAVDAAGNVWHSYSWGSMTEVQVATAAGQFELFGSPFNFQIAGSNGWSDAVPAPGGDMYISTGRLHRLTPNETEAPGWPAGGVSEGPLYVNDIISDGHDGVIVFARYAAGTIPFVKRFDSSSALHPGWPGAGLPLQTLDRGFAPVPIENMRHLFGSGPDHFLAVWTENAGGQGELRVVVQRFSGDASVDPAWPANGVEAVAADSLLAVTPIADGAGGVYIVWQAHGLPRATHLAANGSFFAGLDSDGVSPLDPAAEYVPTTGYNSFAGYTMGELMAADSRPGGGLLFAWNDTRTSPAVSFRIRWLTPRLLPEPGAPDAVVFPASPHPKPGILVGIHSDAADGAFLAWQEGVEEFSGVSDPLAGIWMTHVPAYGLTGVAPPAAGYGVRLSAPRPNPSRGAISLELTLENDTPTRVELLDVSGRVEAATVVEGAGPHTVRLGGDRALVSGLYFVRAAGPNGTSCVRAVLTR